MGRRLHSPPGDISLPSNRRLGGETMRAEGFPSDGLKSMNAMRSGYASAMGPTDAVIVRPRVASSLPCRASLLPVRSGRALLR